MIRLTSMLPKTENDDCPDCKSELRYSRSGSSLVVSCSSPTCSWEAVTTFPVPVVCDHTRYTIYIPALPDASQAILIALNQRLSNGISVTRSLAIRGELPPFNGSALEVWHEAQRLRNVGIPFHIEPSYPFDLDQTLTAFGPPDGPL